MTLPMVRLSNATNRNTPCYKLVIAGVWVVFSYETPIGFGDSQGSGGVYGRQKNHWGPTTGRHFKDAHIDHYPVIEDEDEFYRLMNATLAKAVLENVTDKLET